jgi:hypothetical protein
VVVETREPVVNDTIRERSAGGYIYTRVRTLFAILRVFPFLFVFTSATTHMLISAVFLRRQKDSNFMLEVKHGFF